MAERFGTAPKSASVKANHRLLALSGLLGGCIGLALAAAAFKGRRAGESLSDTMLTGPLPAWLAVVLVVVSVVLIGVLSWRWEQVVDEHERQAYRDGAVAGFYFISIGMPAWWVLARGGLVPPVDAAVSYIGFMLVATVVWLWRKYA